ncbi:hypothetical protein M422DRAFT_22666 [Sphaerobolus stellatus SS14]|nr:hypothetical protein M422DRAFT_22666 [Sphaerobolus stellatus SS14]
MNPSQDLSIQRRPQGQVQVPYDADQIQQLLLKKEELRRQKAAIEAEERQADLQLYLNGLQVGQTQGQSGRSLSSVAVTSFQATTNQPYLVPQSNGPDTSPRIIELDNTGASSTVAHSSATISNRSQITRIGNYASHPPPGDTYRSAYDVPQSQYVRPNSASQNAVDAFVPAQHWASLQPGQGNSNFPQSTQGRVTSYNAHYHIPNGTAYANHRPTEAGNRPVIQAHSAFTPGSSILPHTIVENGKDKERSSFSSLKEGEGSSKGNQDSEPLAVLEELLADHESWSGEASHRIVQSVLGSSGGDDEVVASSTPKANAINAQSNANEAQTNTNNVQTNMALNSQTNSSNSQTSASNMQLNINNTHLANNAQANTNNVQMDEGDRQMQLLTVPKSAGGQTSSVAMSGRPNASNASVHVAVPDPSHPADFNARTTHNVAVESIGNSAHRQGVLSALATPSVTPFTPNGADTKAGTDTPASADRKSLAQSLLRALRPPSAKRKRERDESNIDGAADSPLAKKGKTGPTPAASGQGIPNGLAPGTYPRPALQLTPPVQVPSLTTPRQVPTLTAPRPSRQPTAGQVYSYQIPQYARPSTSSAAPAISQAHQPVPYTMSLQTPFHPSSYTTYYAAAQTANRNPSIIPSPVQLSQPQTAPTQRVFWRTPMTTITSLSVPSYAASSASPKPPIASSSYLALPSSSNKHQGPQPSSHSAPTAPATVAAGASSSSREPLFLPSSLSPTPAPVSSAKTQTQFKKMPVIELSPLRKEMPNSKAQQPLANPSVPTIQDKGVSAPLTTPAVKNASPTKNKASSVKGVKPSGHKPYVLIPRIPGLISKGKRQDASMSNDTSRLDRRQQDVLDEESDFQKRLIRRPCLWKDCHAILDSTEKLLKHVKRVHGEIHPGDKLYQCRWAECPNDLYNDSEKFLRHLRWHIAARIYCAYDGCRFQTLLSSQLVEHLAKDHKADDGIIRPYALPNDIDPPSSLPALSILPAFMSVPIPVSARPIPSARHLKIQAGVLIRIVDEVYKDVWHPVIRNATRRGKPFLLELDTLRKSNPIELYGFTKYEEPSKHFKELEVLPASIEEVDIVEGELLGQPVTREPLSTVSDAEIRGSPKIERSIVKTDAGEEEEISLVGETTTTVLRPVREDVESREVDNLL